MIRSSLPTEPFDFLAAGELSAPSLPVDEAASVLAALGGSGHLTPLGSQQDQNFLVSGADGPSAVLKLANPSFPEQDTMAQDAAAALVAATCPDLRVSTVLETGGRPMRAVLDTSEGPILARLLRYLPGGTFVERGWLAPAVAARMGSIAGRVSRSLADFDHPGLDRRLQWDLRESLGVVELLAEWLGTERDPVLQASSSAWAAVQAAGELDVQPGHFDLTDDNLVCAVGGRLPDGIIDFGDVSHSWRVADLAITLSGLLHHAGGWTEPVLAAVRAFHAEQPLTRAEVDALWPLVVLRSAVLVASGRQQAAMDSANDYASNALDREWRILAAADSVPAPVVTGWLADALGMAEPSPLVSGVPLLTSPPATLDLGVMSPIMDEGAWQSPGLADRAALAAGSPVASGWGVARLSEASGWVPGSDQREATVSTAVTLWNHGDVRAPWDGIVRANGDRLVLPGEPFDLVLHGATGTAGPVRAGELLAESGARVDVQLVRPGTEVPLLVAPELATGWLALTADPSALLGLEAATLASPHDVLARREMHVAEVQEHYYADPPQIERGWRSLLIDTDARPYLDLVNNVASVGHAHPRLAAVANRQLRLLNTNSRFVYEVLPAFAEALASRLPDGLDQVFFVNSGSEAADLAIRLAMAATGRRDIVALAEAYHGWTYASDAVSTSVADNPNALTTRPDWVHTVPAPNSYRGQWRDAEAWRYGPDAAARIRELAAAGRPVAGFIAEAIQGNAGGILLPEGYLREVYGAVRDGGGVAIADEVQVGLGRLGEWFWGFEQQGVVPDIVAVAKGLGNGHPVGAVITTAAIADSYRTGGYFFSSAGGSPLSCAIGSEVLAIIEDEQLQDNARTVGARLRAGLAALDSPWVGTVHGAGLYLGLELVRDDQRSPAPELTAELCERLRQLGVIMQATGDHGNVLKIKPPLVLTAEQADQFIAAVGQALDEL
jgi:4-aminobutyrate aminotransferase-like enzyme/Ser/Thr protein kinase RdoA (MazF antagonist)